MYHLFFKRVLAFLIDYVVIIIYATSLFMASTFLSSIVNFQLSLDSPFKNQLLSFFSLTLPVFLYFYISEKSKSGVTLGKRFLKLKIKRVSESKKKNLFLRNFLKILPWEVAHVGVYQIVLFNNESFGVLILLIIPQITVLIYLISIFQSKGSQSIYDKVSNTILSV